MAEGVNGVNGGLRWQTVAAWLGIAFATLSPAATLLLMVNSQGQQITTLIGRVDALDRRDGIVESMATENRSSLGAIRRDLIEIETQLCAEDSLHNQEHAFDLRLFAVLWKKVTGDVLPTDNAYYAKVGRCLTSTQ